MTNSPIEFSSYPDILRFIVPSTDDKTTLRKRWESACGELPLSAQIYTHDFRLQIDVCVAAVSQRMPSLFVPSDFNGGDGSGNETATDVMHVRFVISKRDFWQLWRRHADDVKELVKPGVKMEAKFVTDANCPKTIREMASEEVCVGICDIALTMPAAQQDSALNESALDICYYLHKLRDDSCMTYAKEAAMRAFHYMEIALRGQW